MSAPPDKPEVKPAAEAKPAEAKPAEAKPAEAKPAAPAPAAAPKPTKLPRLEPGQPVDIGLLLEGTYPYVSGGVSSWVHQIITSMKEYTFALVFLGGSREQYKEPRFQMPPNVVHLECHYLAESWTETKPEVRKGNAKAFEDSDRLHDALRDRAKLPPDLLGRIAQSLGDPNTLSREDFLHSERSWEQVRERYLRNCPDDSFVDYFWSVRIMHAPLFMLAQIAQTAPNAKAFHAISTGYAGFLGALLYHRRGTPLILSEHGIYTKERKIELTHATWIKDNRDAFSSGAEVGVGYVRGLWIRFFEGLGRLTYSASDPIVALYEGNRLRQVADGADSERTCIVPNGIALQRFSPLRANRPPGVPRVLGLLGRVVPIKDIRTFIRSMRTVCDRLPDAEGWIIGPEPISPAYP
jgi:polysaccharide biosynthesis protein PelF